MNKYESMVVIHAGMQESDAALENEKIVNFIKENDGKFLETDVWGKRVLAYEIKKYKEGYYFVNYFLLSPEKIQVLDRFYRLNENIIRHNIIKLKNKNGGNEDVQEPEVPENQ